MGVRVVLGLVGDAKEQRMKATLTFDLPDERSEHLAAVHGLDWALVVWTLDQELRARIKHGKNNMTVTRALEITRERICDLMSNCGLSFEGIE